MSRFRFLVLTAFCAAAVRAESNLSILAAVPHGVDLQYEFRTGKQGFALRSGLVQMWIDDLQLPDMGFGLKPEISYGALFRFGDRSWLKPTMGLAYSYGYTDRSISSNPIPPIRSKALILIPRLETSKRFGWFKLAFEYGLHTSFRWYENERGHPTGSRTFYYLKLEHAVGIAIGFFL